MHRSKHGASQSILQDFSDSSDEEYNPSSGQLQQISESSNSSGDENYQVYRNMQRISNVKNSYQPPIKSNKLFKRTSPRSAQYRKSSIGRSLPSDTDPTVKYKLPVTYNKNQIVNGSKSSFKNEKPGVTMRKKSRKERDFARNSPKNDNNIYTTSECDTEPRNTNSKVLKLNQFTKPQADEKSLNESIQPVVPQNLNNSVLDSFLKRFDAEFAVNTVVIEANKPEVNPIPSTSKEKESIQNTRSYRRSSFASASSEQTYGSKTHSSAQKKDIQSSDSQEEDVKIDKNLTPKKKVQGRSQPKKPRVDLSFLSFPASERRTYSQETDNESDASNSSRVTTRCGRISRSPSVYVQATMIGSNRDLKELRKARRASTYVSEPELLNVAPLNDTDIQRELPRKQSKSPSQKKKVPVHKSPQREPTSKEKESIQNTRSYRRSSFASASSEQTYGSKTHSSAQKKDIQSSDSQEEDVKIDKNLTPKKKVQGRSQPKKPRVDLSFLSFPASERRTYSQETDNESDASNSSRVTTRCGRISRSPSVYVQATMIGSNRDLKELRKARRASTYVSEPELLNVAPLNDTDIQRELPRKQSKSPSQKKKVPVHKSPQREPTSKKKTRLFKSPSNLDESYCISETGMDADAEYSQSEYDYNAYSKKSSKRPEKQTPITAYDDVFKRPSSKPPTRIFREAKTPPNDSNSPMEKENYSNHNEQSNVKYSNRKSLQLHSPPAQREVENKNIIIHDNISVRSSSKTTMPLSPFSNKSYQQRPVKSVRPSLLSNDSFYDTDGAKSQSFHNLSNGSNFGESFYDDRLSCRENQNQIYTVVNDQVISLDWFAPMPNMDCDGMRVGIKYSLPNLKSHLTTTMVGYLKIEAGQQKPLQVAKKHNILYKVETGQGIVRLFERKRLAEAGSTFYIPLGAEYTILNASTDTDLLLFFVKMSAP